MPSSIHLRNFLTIISKYRIGGRFRREVSPMKPWQSRIPTIAIRCSDRFRGELHGWQNLEIMAQWQGQCKADTFHRPVFRRMKSCQRIAVWRPE